MPTDPRDVTLQIVEDVLEQAPVHGVDVRLWDGTRWPERSDAAATIVLRHPASLRRMLVPGTPLGLGQAFLRDDFDVEGDLERVMALAGPVRARLASVGARLRLAAQVSRLPAAPRAPPPARRRARLSGKEHSVERDRQAVRYHYDVSNEFYALWLDPRMVYSCAYFRSPDDTLAVAQEQKLDLVCRKLRLREGQTLLDVGCGWGALVMHAAREYGVRATGITLSERQAELAQRRIKEEGLEDLARVEVRDYREMTGQFDALVSVGMFEHVGAAMLPAYFAKAHALLRPGGVFLNHGIAAVGARGGRDPFIQRYVFPDGDLVPIHETLRAAASAGFEARDVESLREHYALTLRRWVRGLESRRDEARRHVDEATYRVWRLYMAGSAGSFARGELNIYQALLAKPDAQGRLGLPLTREDWYQSHSTTS